jgi:MipA family protein
MPESGLEMNRLSLNNQIKIGQDMKKLKKVIFKFLIILIFIMFFNDVVFSGQVVKYPLWEFGLFHAEARFPHYRGSDEHQWYVLPLPDVVYREDTLQPNHEGLRGIFYDGEYIESSVSLQGNLSVSRDSEVREEMPQLDPIFEIGPAIRYHILGRHPTDSLFLKITLQAAYSLNFDHAAGIRYEGFRSGLNLIYFNKSFFEKYGLSYGLNAGIDFSNSKLHSYFYDVSYDHIGREKHFYESDSGYSGFSVAGALQKQLTEKLVCGIYSRLDNISGTMFDDSHLLQKDNTFIFGAALIWRIDDSKKLVSWDDT